MQLIFLAGLLSFTGHAQFTDSIPADTTAPEADPAVIQLLYSYYEQEGIHAAVTGGKGTEELNNHAPKIAVTIPLDPKNTISATGGFDFYSSASSDNINNPFLLPDHISGASADDVRSFADISYQRHNPKKHRHWNVGMGISEEWDVAGYSGTIGYEGSTKDENKTFNISAKYIYDDWLLIYPIELRQGTKQWLPTDIRESMSLSMTYTAIINYRMQASLSGDIIYQKGMLSTPFHRVYFNDGALVKVEKAPDSRLKLPVAGRFHYYFSNFVLLRFYHRFYWDDFGITANTTLLELPVKASYWLSVYPFFRYHVQSAADHFAPWGEHVDGADFYTSDYDLSAFNSLKFGLGLGITPLFGFTRSKIPFTQGKRLMIFKRIDLRYARYERSDGLTANVFSIGLKFESESY